jgi:O-antigen/teichoic acid export membrane protein
MNRFAVLRLRPFDTETEEGRHQERYRRAGLTTLTSMVSRFVALAVIFVSVRVALPYLGEARFGIWATISSLISILMIFDFGIGNSMVSRVAALAAKSDQAALRKLIISGLSVLGVMGVLLGATLVCLAAYVPLSWLYKGASTQLIEEARGALMLFGVLFGLSVPLQAIHRIYAGLQEGYVASCAVGFMGLLSLLALPLIPRMHAGIASLLLVTYGLQVAAGVILLVALHKRFKLALPRLGELRESKTRDLLTSGGLFFVLQVTAVIGWDMDPVLLSTLVGPASAATYSVVQRMFLLVAGPLSMLNSPLWGSYADANTRGDFEYIRRTLSRSLLLTFFLALLGVGAVLLVRQPVLHLLTKGILQPPGSFILMFGVWTIVAAVGDALAMYLNGLHALKPQIVASVSFLVVAIILKMALITRYGLNGVVAATLISYLSTVVVLFMTVFRKAIFAPLRATQMSEHP